MPQPVPFTTTCFWSNWSQWLRDLGPQSVLDYPPPPPKGPMFQIFLNQAYLECPNLYLSPQPVFGRIGHNGSEIQVLKVCSTIRPRKKAPCFSFFEPNIFGMPQPMPFPRTCFSSNWSQWPRDPRPQSVLEYLPPPKKVPMFQNFFEPSIFGRPQPVPFTGTCFWLNWSQWLRDPRPQRVLDYQPQNKGPMFQIFFNQAYLECPNLCLSPKLVFEQIGHNGSEIQVLQICSTIRPRKKAPCFRFFLNQAYLECPNLYLSAQPVFGRIGHNGSEIHVLKVCSTIRSPPPPKGPMFQIFLNQAYLEGPNLYLSPKPVFGRIGHNGSEIHVLKVCSAIRPPPPQRPHSSNFF